MQITATHSIRVEETITIGGDGKIDIKYDAYANDCSFVDGLVHGEGKTRYKAVCDLALNLATKVNELRSKT
jgi:hypothetical protein